MTSSRVGHHDTLAVLPTPFLLREQHEILDEWKRRVRSEANELGVIRTEPALARYVPEVLARLIQEDGDLSGERLIPTATIPIAEGCTVSEAVHELSLFRSTVLRAIARAGMRLPSQTADLVHRVIDEAIGEVVSEIHHATCSRLEASDRASRSLRENEDRMRLALSAAEVGTWELRPLSGELMWDARARELWGVPAHVEPSYELFVSGIHPEDRARVEAIVERTLHPASGGTYKVEYRAIGVGGGPERWVSCEGKVFFDETGRPLRFIGTVLDVTERRREADFRERFVGMLGHDLRQPLSVVTFASETLLKQAFPEVTADLVRRIARSGDRMSRMVRDLLDFARARQGGGIPIAREEVDLHEVVQHLVDEIGTLHPERTLQLAFDGDGTGMWDPDRMTQVFQNLLGNAVTYGAPDAPIYIVMVDEGRDLEISITNYGRPIPQDELAMLFNPYRRGGSAGKRAPRGLGLGLYIAQEIVRAHGGTLEATSDPHAGTTFTVLMPRR